MRLVHKHPDPKNAFWTQTDFYCMRHGIDMLNEIKNQIIAAEMILGKGNIENDDGIKKKWKFIDVD